jgi:signal transduction histidine kinase
LPIDNKVQIWLHTILGIAFATYVISTVYIAVRTKLFTPHIDNSDNPDSDSEIKLGPAFHQRILAYSFLMYAVVQLSYILILFDNTRYLITHVLYVVLIIKFINAYGLTMTLREDYAELRARAKRNEEKLRLEKKERSEFEEIGLLTASIEHELRTPLGALRSKLNEMAREYQHLENIQKDVALLQTQRERILNATRTIRILRAGHEFFSKKLAMLNLMDMARSAVKDLKKELDIDNIIFEYEEKLKPALVIAHPQLIEQVIINILKNAAESINSHSTRGGKVIISTARSKDSKQLLVMEFKDNGGGFPAGSLHRLTQPDFSTKVSEKPNRGLGLFICERIIRLHQGTIEFKDEPTGGAIVSICLQRATTKKERKRDINTGKNNTDEEDTTEDEFAEDRGS